jgi:uncharacterized membrane protein YczE
VEAAALVSARPSRWRASPARLASLAFGLALFGAGDGLIVASALGNSPWTVFAEGLAHQTPLTIGAATVVISFVVLLLWIPLRQLPGLGTVANAMLIGLAIDATLWAVPDDPAAALKAIELIGGIGLVAVGSAFYLGATLGPGPRDGLMTGVHRVTGRPVGLVRAGIELSALGVGIALGGTFGVGTIVFALSIGPSVALALRLARVEKPSEL